MNYKAVIFDMDGTLLDTLDGIIEAMNLTFQDLGFPNRFSKEDGKYFIGAGATEFARRALARANIQNVDFLSFRNSFLTRYEVCQKTGTKPFENLDKLLNKLKENGYLVGICSNKPQELLNQITAKMYPNNKFDLIVGQRTGIPCKPEPQMFDICKNELGLKDSEILYVGDSEYDYLFAKNSNVDCCIVTYGYGMYDQEFMHHTKYHADTVQELERMLLNK